MAMTTEFPDPAIAGPGWVFDVTSIERLADGRGGAPIWIQRDGAIVTYREFSKSVAAARRVCELNGVKAGDVIVTPGDARLESLIWLFGAAQAGAIVAPLRRERSGEWEQWSRYISVNGLIKDGSLRRVQKGTNTTHAEALLERLRTTSRPGLILATGGTTGEPKLVLHDLSALFSVIRMREGKPVRILPLMRFDHIGGLDIVWRALANGQILVEPPVEYTPEKVAQAIAQHRVEVLPATPSFLNLFLMSEVGREYNLNSLKTVPYGAEPMPSTLLDKLHAEFPHVDFVQRFGTSETGALPVHDTGAGIALRSDQGTFAWKIVDGELWVRSPARALGYLSGQHKGFHDGGWFHTGDLAETMPDGSVRILGRREELINVGGEKVLPSEVERVLLAHPHVADCRVWGERNGVLGQVVAAEIVWMGQESSPVSIKRILQEFVAPALPRHKQPAVVRLLTRLETTRNFKKARPIPA